METTYYDASGQVSSISQDTNAIIKDTIIQSERFFIMTYSIDKARIFCTNRVDGYYEYFKYDRAYLSLKYPATSGESYPFTSLDVSIVSTDTLISAPKGNYHCYHYSINARSGPSYSANEYYSPGIGFVRREYAADRNAIVTIRSKLKDYIIH